MEHIININVFLHPEEVEIGDEIEVEGGEDQPEEIEDAEVEAELEPKPVELIDDEPEIVPVTSAKPIAPAKPISKIVPMDKPKSKIVPAAPVKSSADKQVLTGPQIPHTKVPSMSHIKSMDDLMKVLAQGQ